MVKVLVSGEWREVEEELWKALLGPVPPHGFINNGCTMSPDYLRGKHTWPACVFHDYHYNVGSTGRKLADSWFRKNLVKCLRHDGMNRFSSHFYSFIYWRAVRRLGGSFYNAAGDRS